MACCVAVCRSPLKGWKSRVRLKDVERDTGGAAPVVPAAVELLLLAVVLLLLVLLLLPLPLLFALPLLLPLLLPFALLAPAFFVLAAGLAADGAPLLPPRPPR